VGEEEFLLGTGFFISSSGHVVTSYNTVKEAKVIVVARTDAEAAPATIVAEVKDSDLVILKVDKRDHECLPVASSFDMKLGATVATVGFPNVEVQGISPKMARGEVSSLAGFDDDPRLFQMNVPIQFGNGGGALVDVRGNVVGMICARLAVPTAEGAPVGYAVKSSVLLNLIESVPGLREQLPSPHQRPRSLEDVVAALERASVMVVVK
jgi:S1-C subfamily serine protease